MALASAVMSTVRRRLLPTARLITLQTISPVVASCVPLSLMLSTVIPAGRLARSSRLSRAMLSILPTSKVRVRLSPDITGSFEALMASCDIGSLFTTTVLLTLTMSMTLLDVTRTGAVIRLPANAPGTTGALMVIVRLSPAAKVFSAQKASIPSIHHPPLQPPAFGSTSVVK